VGKQTSHNHGMEQASRILPTVAGLSKSNSDGKPASTRADLMALLTAQNTAQLSNSGGSPIPCNTNDCILHSFHNRHNTVLLPFFQIYLGYQISLESWGFPLPSNRQHLSNDDCLQDKREHYQNCSVWCCVWQLFTMICIHTHTCEQFLKFTIGLGLFFVDLFRFSILFVFVF